MQAKVLKTGGPDQTAQISAPVGQVPVTEAKKKQPLGMGMGNGAHQVTLGAIGTAPQQLSEIDGTRGVHLKKILGERTLASAAANPKHLAKMEESAQVIGTLERLPGNLHRVTLKTQNAFKLYKYSFPDPDEREAIQDIKDRLKTYNDGAQADGGAFHALAIADKQGNVIGYTQGSVVPSDKGLFFYWQYGCVADRAFMKQTYDVDSNPREHGILNTIHGVNAALLETTAHDKKQPALGMVWESEPKGQGDDPASIQFTGKRLQIHNQAGGRVLMGMTKDGEMVNLHLQPKLDESSDWIALHMMFRPLKYKEGDEFKRGEIPKADGEAMLLAWYENFRREGFAEKDVDAAEKVIRERLARIDKIVLMPVSEVPDVVTLAKTDDVLREQILKKYGVPDLDAARRYYEDAMAAAI